MSTRIALNHTTTYRYDRPVSLSPQLVRLRPAPHCRTEIQEYRLTIKPVEHLIHWQQDPFNNHIARLTFPEKIDELRLEVAIVANIASINPFDFLIDDAANKWPFDYSESLQLDLQPYLMPEEHGEELQAFLQSLPLESAGIIDFLLQVNSCIFDRIEYIERLESGVQTSSETLLKRSGSCRDSAWLLVQTLRHLGLAARFVSGYSVQLAIQSADSLEVTGTDSTDLHAWAEVFIPGAGWLGFDPTSGLLAGEGYIPLCCTRAPASAAALSGTMEKTITNLQFENIVTRLPNR